MKFFGGKSKKRQEQSASVSLQKNNNNNNNRPSVNSNRQSLQVHPPNQKRSSPPEASRQSVKNGGGGGTTSTTRPSPSPTGAAASPSSPPVRKSQPPPLPPPPRTPEPAIRASAASPPSPQPPQPVVAAVAPPQPPQLQPPPQTTMPLPTTAPLQQQPQLQQPQQAMMQDSNLATIELTRNLVKKFIADIWNRGEVDLIPEVCSPSLRFNGNTGFDRVGHDGLARMVATIREALDDYHCEIHSMVVEHNKAFCRLRFTGKHTGNLLGYPPTGRVVGWMGATEFTVQNGKILKVWELGDIKTLEEQLIAIDSPGPGGVDEED